MSSVEFLNQIMVLDGGSRRIHFIRKRVSGIALCFVQPAVVHESISKVPTELEASRHHALADINFISQN